MPTSGLNFPRYLLPSLPRWDPAVLKRHRPTEDVTQSRTSSASPSSPTHSRDIEQPTRHERLQSHDSGCGINDSDDDGQEETEEVEVVVQEPGSYEFDQHSYASSDSGSDSESAATPVDHTAAAGVNSSSESLEIYMDTESGYGGSDEEVVIGSASTNSSPPQHHHPSRFNIFRSKNKKPKSSAASTVVAPTLPTTASYLHCLTCRTHICFTSSIISKGFTGRHGRAYLVTPTTLILSNIHHAKPTNRPLQTGAHTVSDISCKICGSNLGWKYIHAEERTQRYKIGKYILETGRVGKMNYWDGEAGDCLFDGDDGQKNTGKGRKKSEDWKLERIKREGWEVGWEAPDMSDEEDDGVEVDLADEEELEEMFAGTWNKEKVLRRRDRKKQIAEMRRKVDSNV